MGSLAWLALSTLGEPSNARTRFGTLLNYDMSAEDILDNDDAVFADTDRDILDYDDTVFTADGLTSRTDLDTLDSVLSLGGVLRQTLINFILVRRYIKIVTGCYILFIRQSLSCPSGW